MKSGIRYLNKLLLNLCEFCKLVRGEVVLLCLWIHAPLTYINNCPTRCNTKQSIYYSASTLYMFYVYGSVYRWSILIIVQRDATQSNLFIILQVHSTCFGCQTHPSSGVHKTVTTASSTVRLPPSNVANLAMLEGGSCTKKYDQYHRL